MLIFVKYTVDTYIEFSFYETKRTILLTITVFEDKWNGTKGKHV